MLPILIFHSFDLPTLKWTYCTPKLLILEQSYTLFGNMLCVNYTRSNMDRLVDRANERVPQVMWRKDYYTTELGLNAVREEVVPVVEDDEGLMFPKY